MLYNVITVLYQRTSPTEKDRQIQSRLGDFQCLKQLIEHDASQLVGVSSSQIRPQPSFPPPLSSQPKSQPQPQLPTSQSRNPVRQVFLPKHVLSFQQIKKLQFDLSEPEQN